MEAENPSSRGGINLLRDSAPIRLADGMHRLRYDFAAWALLEELQGGFDEALAAGWIITQQGASFRDLAIFLAAGLAHERPDLAHAGVTTAAAGEIAALMLPALRIDYETAVSEALKLAEFEALDDVAEAEEGSGWDWDRAFYMVTGVLGRKEAEFWSMTPKRFSRLVRGYLLFHKLPEDGNQEQGGGRRRKGPQTEADVMGFLGMLGGG